MNIYFYIGTIAEYIKMMPIMRELMDRKIPFKIISTGQNNLLESDINDILGLEKIDIIISSSKVKQTPSGLIIWFVKTFFKALFRLRKEFKNIDKKNTVILVHGDTVSTVMGSIIAFLYRIRVAHVEAGLRSFNYLHPFPEEIDRIFVSRIARLHFCPNEWAMGNLKGKKGKIVNTFHNTLVDGLDITLKSKLDSKILTKIHNQKFFLVVFHRNENIYNSALVKFLMSKIFELSKSMKCVFILYGPTKEVLANNGLLSEMEKNPNFILTERLQYFEIVNILNEAQLLLTDGGSTQEESYYLGVPTLVLRHRTERIEGLGTNVILSNNEEKAIDDFIKNYKNYRHDHVKPEIRPSKIIVDTILL